MSTEFSAFDAFHPQGEGAMHPKAPRSAHHAALLLLAHSKCAASSRLAWHADHGALGRIQLPDLGGCRTWSVESEKQPQRAQFSPDLQPHSPAMGQKTGEKWAAAADFSLDDSKSDSLLG